MTAAALEPQPTISTDPYGWSHIFAGLGAFGVALQNYQAVELVIRGLVNPASMLSTGAIQAAALGAGGLCSGMVNFWMNVELLDGFFARMESSGEFVYKTLTLLQQIQYFAGIFVFVVTGVLFGLMAFTFAMGSPLALLSIAVGVFVAGIMTIQEVETWLSSYDPKPIAVVEQLTPLQQFGKWCGHIIAAGNVLALSLLFTVSLAQALILVDVAAFPALMAGFVIAFTFGAFTEYYFYNFYLADFCKDFGDKCKQMMDIPNAWFGLLCIATNALVNAALTYAGVMMLTGLLVAASIALPPVAVMVTLAIVSAIFAGSASYALGMAFWIRQNPVEPEIFPVQKAESIGANRNSIFALSIASNQPFTQKVDNEDIPVEGSFMHI